MGYNTQFEINISPLPEQGKWIAGIDFEVFRQMLPDDQATWVLQQDATGKRIVSEDEARWHEELRRADMQKISSQYPVLLFTVEGHGEEPEDIWREYYVAGKMQRATARIQFDPFDPKRLQ